MIGENVNIEFIIKNPEQLMSGHKFYHMVVENPDKFQDFIIKGNQIWDKKSNSLIYEDIDDSITF